jgi:hypothetical protein
MQPLRGPRQNPVAYSRPVVDPLPGPDPAAGQAPNPATSGLSIFIATPMHGGMAAGTYSWSLAQTPAVFIRNGLGLLYQSWMNDTSVANSRNQLVRQFLDTQATHLMWIDADIAFSPLDIVSMVSADQDIVCGACPRNAIDWERVAKAVGDGIPSEELKSHVASFEVKRLEDSDASAVGGLVEVAAASAGFMLVKRGVIEELAGNLPEYLVDGITLKEFFTTGIDPETNEWVGADEYFCRLARSVGFKIYASPYVHLNRTGPYTYDGQLEPNWLT